MITCSQTIEKEVIDNFLPDDDFNFIRKTLSDVSF